MDCNQSQINQVGSVATADGQVSTVRTFQENIEHV